MQKRWDGKVTTPKTEANHPGKEQNPESWAGREKEVGGSEVTEGQWGKELAGVTQPEVPAAGGRKRDEEETDNRRLKQEGPGTSFWVELL